jgi:hypothetical protein
MRRNKKLGDNLQKSSLPMPRASGLIIFRYLFSLSGLWTSICIFSVLCALNRQTWHISLRALHEFVSGHPRKKVCFLNPVIRW